MGKIFTWENLTLYLWEFQQDFKNLTSNTGICVSGKHFNRKKILGCLMKILRATWHPEVCLTETFVYVWKNGWWFINGSEFCISTEFSVTSYNSIASFNINFFWLTMVYNLWSEFKLKHQIFCYKSTATTFQSDVVHATILLQWSPAMMNWPSWETVNRWTVSFSTVTYQTKQPQISQIIVHLIRVSL